MWLPCSRSRPRPSSGKPLRRKWRPRRPPACALVRNRCEYCRIHQQHYLITFHVEHIIARQHRGSDADSNLALACHFCNRHKGPNVAGLDPATGVLTRLFNPRTDVWSHHFRIERGRILGLTPVGRTSVEVQQMNCWIVSVSAVSWSQTPSWSNRGSVKNGAQRRHVWQCQTCWRPRISTRRDRV